MLRVLYLVPVLFLAGCFAEDSPIVKPEPEKVVCKYTDETSCVADSKCEWRKATLEKPARCKEKA